MTAEEIAQALIDKRDVQTLIFHECQKDKAVASRRFPSLQPDNFACPVCGKAPGIVGFRYAFQVDGVGPVVVT
jgi:hypothetical protein